MKKTLHSKYFSHKGSYSSPYSLIIMTKAHFHSLLTSKLETSWKQREEVLEVGRLGAKPLTNKESVAIEVWIECGEGLRSQVEHVRHAEASISALHSINRLAF